MGNTVFNSNSLGRLENEHGVGSEHPELSYRSSNTDANNLRKEIIGQQQEEIRHGNSVCYHVRPYYFNH